MVNCTLTHLGRAEGKRSRRHLCSVAHKREGGTRTGEKKSSVRLLVNWEISRKREWLTWPAVADVAINKILANGTVAAGRRATFVNIHFAESPRETWRTAEKNIAGCESGPGCHIHLPALTCRLCHESCFSTIHQNKIKKKNVKQATS